MPMVTVSELKFDIRLYPRANVDESHVNSLARAVEGGSQLPPIIVSAKDKKIVDGVHRVHMAQKLDWKTISAEIRKYKNDAEMFRDAVALNSIQGLKLGIDDSLKVIEIGSTLGFGEKDIALMLHTSLAHLRAIKPRFATFQATRAGVKELRRIALKGSVRHLSGTTINAQQVTAIESAPGQSYMLTIRQLLDALKYNLLPEETQHPALWKSLRELHDELSRAI